MIILDTCSENGNKTSMTMTPLQHVSLRLETRTTLHSFLETLQINCFAIFTTIPRPQHLAPRGGRT